MSTLSSRLRQACADVRRKSEPLANLIPLMQQSADKIDELNDKIDELELELKDQATRNT